MTESTAIQGAAPIEIFKTGTHTDIKGRKLTFSAADLEQAVAAYDPALHEAPLVIGHPTLEAPAYGWVKSLSFDDGKLLAQPDQVDASFAALVNAGRFKKVSASFFLPDATDNPKPGSYYLHHVGFLGAAEPAVKGLKSVSFSANAESLIEFANDGDMDGWDMMRLGRWFSRIRDFLVEQFGAEQAERAIPKDDLDFFLSDAGRKQAEAMAAHRPAFAAPQPSTETNPNMNTPEQTADLAAREAELKAREQQLQQQQASFAAQQAQIRREADTALVEELVKAGKLTPAMKPGLLAFMAQLDDTGKVSFAASEGKTEEQPARDFFTGFLKSLPAVVPFGEHARAGNAPGENRASFAVAPGFTVNAEKLALHERALAYQQEHKTTYETAIAAVSQG